jgi:hypothetical protein
MAARRWLWVLAWIAFALALLSAEFGMCALGYIAAHASLVDRAPWRSRVFALAPYAIVLGIYLAYYYAGDFGVVGSGFYRDLRGAPLEAALGFLAAVPVYVACALTISYASVYALGAHGPALVLILSLGFLAALLPLLAAGWRARPRAAWFSLGALLSLFPLVATVPQDRLTFFVSLAACGLLGPWVADEFHASSRWRRGVARTLWRMHGIYMPLLFVPCLFLCRSMSLGGGALALDSALPQAAQPVTVLLNAPTFLILHYQAMLRRSAGRPTPPVMMLYAGSQPVEVKRTGLHSLELTVTQSWFATALEQIRDLRRFPYRPGDRIRVQHMIADVREIDRSGAPTRVEFTFDQPLESSQLSFLSWERRSVDPWRPPELGKSMQLAASATF